MKNSLLVVILLLSMLSCSKKTEKPSQNTDSISKNFSKSLMVEDSLFTSDGLVSVESLLVKSKANAENLIKATLIDMWDAIEKRDIDRYASYVHEDFTQFGEYDSILRSGKSAEVKGIKDWIESSSPIHTEMHDPKVTVKGDIAFITYFWSDSGSTDGKPFATHGKSTRIFVKENDKWLCIHGHYTLLPEDENSN